VLRLTPLPKISQGKKQAALVTAKNHFAFLAKRYYLCSHFSGSKGNGK
jgi:hypothetical protein